MISLVGGRPEIWPLSCPKDGDHFSQTGKPKPCRVVLHILPLFSLPPIFLGACTTTQRRIRTGSSDTGSFCFSGPADCGSWSMVRLRPGGTPGAGGGTVDRARRGPWALRVFPVAGTAADGARLGPRVAGPPAALSALPGLFVEATVIAPFALVYMAWVISRATSTLLLCASRRADARLLGCPRGSPQQQP